MNASVELDHFMTPNSAPTTTLPDRLRHWAGDRPGETAFSFWNGDDPEPAIRLSYAQLDRRARSVAAELQRRGLAGERALLLYPPGLEFIVALFGCLYAGVVAVPTSPPRRNRSLSAIDAIRQDAQAAIVLWSHTTSDINMSLLRNCPALAETPRCETAALADELADAWAPKWPSPTDVAVLQYTSGSTGTPKGVVLHHHHLMHNCQLIAHGFRTRPAGELGLFWLPTYHDMGLVGGLLEPLYLGLPAILMAPLAFLQKPVRWLQGISRFGATISGGPNFAFALCNEKVSTDACRDLDLSRWNMAFTGAEPIQAETLETFTRKFAPYGFQASAFYPCYGMAETTLIVTGGIKEQEPVVREFGAQALEQHRVQSPPAPGVPTRRLVSSGRVLPGQEVAIVDTDNLRPAAAGHVGEIWIRSPSVAGGYWNQPQLTDRIFRARLAGRDEPYLRSGDLGFLRDGELFITGRCKDIIVIRGRNLYPHDVEQTVEKCHADLRATGGVCFSIEVLGAERLVIVQELKRRESADRSLEILDAIRQAVLEVHDAPLHAIVLLKPGRLPKTSSGKQKRQACRELYLQNELEALAHWTADPVGASAPPDIERSNQRRRQGKALGESELQDWLFANLAARLGRDRNMLGLDDPFTSLGLDSLAAVEIAGELESLLGRTVSPALLFNFPNVRSLANHLTTPESVHHGSLVKQRSIQDPVAVIGMACRFPGADSPDAYWQLLASGRDAIGVMTESRQCDVDWRVLPQELRSGGFLQTVDQFEPQFFGISPREAAAMDPQQRLLMEVAWEAFENAGLVPGQVAETPFGIFIGISNCDYGRPQAPSRWNGIDVHTGTGVAPSVAAGRLAHFFGVHGPCLAVDTACSSSLVAVHLAVQSLERGECHAALAGGVNLILDPRSTVALSRLQALAKDGRCKAFDASADGYGRGEGCGLVLLKRLADAEADGDPILAVIRGSAVNHDGRSSGLTTPHGPSQEALLQAALSSAGISATHVDYVEAHGTGTSLGDPIELQAMAEVLGRGRNATAPLIVGSVKTNVGHLEAAAGIAGLIKTVLMLQRAQIPAHLHLHQPNPFIPWDRLSVHVPARLTEWPERRSSRVAGVSSFGFSGTNAHVVLESAPIRGIADVASPPPSGLLVLSARDETALRDLALRYREALRERPEDYLQICQSAALCRTHFAHRLAMVQDDPLAAADGLAAFATGETPHGLVVGRVDVRTSSPESGDHSGNGRPDGVSDLQDAADRYVRGLDVPWGGIFRHASTPVGLPNYPFQRSRYWLDHPTSEPAEPPAVAPTNHVIERPAVDPLKLFWRPHSQLDQQIARIPVDYIPPVAAIEAHLRHEIERIVSQWELPRYVDLFAALDRLSIDFIREAFEQLGGLPPQGVTFSSATLVAQWKLPGPSRLLDRLLTTLAEEGLLRRSHDGWVVPGAANAAQQPQATLASLQQQFPECRAEWALLSACAGSLAGVLRGEIDPLQLLFPSGSTKLLEALYRDSPFARSLNALLEEAVAQAIRDLPAHRPLRILELGAGTGGTTSYLLPRLPQDRTEYLFTDVSEVFTREAARTFRHYPFVRFGILDIELSPETQGFAGGQFDLVIASNVLHATRDLRESLRNVHQLLKPGGALLLLEGTRPQRWLDLIFGLTPGWWHFSDHPIRPGHPLVSEGTWRELLADEGYVDTAAWPAAQGSRTVAPPQTVLFARSAESSQPKPAHAPRTARVGEEGGGPGQLANRDTAAWLILADRQGIAHALARSLHERNQNCRVADVDEMTDEFVASQSLRGIVDLSGLNLPASGDKTAGSLRHSVPCVRTPVHAWIDRLVRTSLPSIPGTLKVWIVTRGAQWVRAADQVASLDQSLLWGWGPEIDARWPSLLGGYVDLDAEASVTSAAELLCMELLRPDDELQIAFRGDQRYVARLARSPRGERQPRSLRWRADASYLVACDSVDEGWAAARWMADQGAHHVVVCHVGTDSPDALPANASDDCAGCLESIASRGVTIHRTTIDVADPATLRTMLQELSSAGWPPLRGAILREACGRSADPQQSASPSADAPCRPLDVPRAWYLLPLLKEQRWDFLWMVDGGGAGAGMLASDPVHVGNQSLDAFAHYLTAQGLAVLSVSKAGRDAPCRWEAMQELFGTGVMGHVICPERIEEEPRHGSIGAMRWVEGLWRDLAAESSMADAPSSHLSAARQAELIQATPEARRALIDAVLREEIGRVLRIRPEQLELEHSLNELGIDSLMAVELRNHVEARLGLTISLAVLMRDPSLSDLVKALLQEVEGVATISDTAAVLEPESLIRLDPGPGVGSAFPAPISSSRLQDLQARVDDLSDEEVDAMLRALLSEESQQS